VNNFLEKENERFPVAFCLPLNKIGLLTSYGGKNTKVEAISHLVCDPWPAKACIPVKNFTTAIKQKNPMNNETATGQRHLGNHKSTALPAGAAAPDFGLKSTPDQTVQLGEFRGQPVVLAFYPADWSPVCGDQMALYNEMLPEFKELGAELLGISVDGVWCHTAFSQARKLHFPLLADFEPKGAIARLYGVYREADGTSERALFVINAEGIIHWSYVSPVGVNPGADGILAALEELQSKQEVK
jgi:peroxiredoxin